MYPAEELTGLAARKALLQARIAVRRWEYATAAAELSRPLAQVDRGIALWGRLSPMIKLLAAPAGLLFARLLGGRASRRGETGIGDGGSTRKRSRLATLLSLAPVILRGVKFAQQFRAARKGPPPRENAVP